MSATAVLPRRPLPAPRDPAVAPPRYFPALDGIRALAVIGVMAYHFGVPYSAGGFLGVDLFFVLSGYLITSQLITRWVFEPSVHRADFARFWAARARRLFPALATMLVATTTVVAVADRAQLSLYRGDLAAAASYSSNWWYVFHKRSYFAAAGRPPLLQHLWSLAVEEQFYLLWPVVIWAIIALARRRVVRERALLVTAVGLMLASAAVMGVGSAVTHVPELGDPSRWYFGTDSHSMGLLAGAALAALRHGDGLGSRSTAPVPPAGRATTAVGLAALLGVVVALSQVGEYSTVLYRVGFLAFSLLAAALIAVAVRPGPLERLLSHRSLVAIGRRSYGLYLWHWPVAAMTRPGLDLHWPSWTVFVFRVALTVALTEATYRWVEEPVRRLGWQRYWQRISDWRRGPLYGAYVPLLAMAVLAALCWPSHDPIGHQRAYAVGVTYVRCPLGTDGGPQRPVTAPPGARCLNPAVAPDVTPDGPTRGSTPLLTGPTAPATPTAPTAPTTPATPTTPYTSPSATHPAPPPTRAGAGPLDRQALFVYGDSVPLGAIAQLTGIFGSVTNHAVEGIQAWNLLPQLIQDGDAGRLKNAVVLLHTGDNGLIDAGQLRQALRAASDARLVILATPHVDRTWQAPDLRIVEQAAREFGNTVLLDWNKDMVGHSDWVYSDGIHLTPPGRVAYSRLVARAARQ